MIWHPIIAAFVTFLNALKTSIPAFSYHLGAYGQVTDATSIDHSAISRSLQSLVIWDRFIPIHDALFPACAVSVSVVTVFLGVKLVKFVISCIPTVGAAG